MNPIEILAAALGVVNVALVVRRSLWNYPFGLAMVALYFFVFFEAKLYSDALLQIFFFAVQLYGWWAWARADRAEDAHIVVERMALNQRLAWATGVLALALVWGSAMARLTDAAAPHVDGAIAIASIAAQLLQSRRRVECWWLWIAVDLAAIPLFLSRGLTVTAGLYGIFLILALLGLREWQQKVRI
ncbi:nicotinamide riboside transporter PnuC [Sphingomonas swuensis]|uniref:Nicotinamide riboside transporter PnuC n=1 Tax=Sphingomonas swuensis TaxID=977800 RepID=A0ABP7SX19_9SPHN